MIDNDFFSALKKPFQKSFWSGKKQKWDDEKEDKDEDENDEKEDENSWLRNVNSSPPPYPRSPSA